MIRRVTAIAVAGVIGVAGAAAASSSHAAKTYKASLTANANATTAGVPDVKGKAQLVDGKRNKASLHMRHLAPNTTYLWHVHEGSCATPGAPVTGWTYRTMAGANGTLTTDADGNANTKGTSKDFNADPAKTYSINVHVAAETNGLAAGTIIACGDLKATKKAKTHGHTHTTQQAHPAKPDHPSQAKGPKTQS
jgi:hypothetical protein